MTTQDTDITECSTHSSVLRALPRLDLTKTLELANENQLPHSLTLRSSRQRNLTSSLNTEFIELKLLYDRNAYLTHTPRVPRAKSLGPLVPAFECFANWANPKFQVPGILTFDKIVTANSTMNVSEAFSFCYAFGIFDDNFKLITKPEVQQLFAMTVCSDSDVDAKWTSAIDAEILRDFEKHKSRTSRDMTEQKFPFFLCRIAIVIFSKEKGHQKLTTTQKVQRFIRKFRFDDFRYVKHIVMNAKSTSGAMGLKNKRRPSWPNSAQWLVKKTGLTNSGAMGLQLIKRHLSELLFDVDIATAVKPLVNLQLATKKRDWVMFEQNHLNIDNIYVSSNLQSLKEYRYKVQITNKHPSKSFTFVLDATRIPKYLIVKYENKVLSPGMTCSIFMRFVDNVDVLLRFNGRKLRSYIPVDIVEKHHYNKRSKGMPASARRHTVLQSIQIPVTACFQFIKFQSSTDVFLSEQMCTPRDYPVEK